MHPQFRNFLAFARGTQPSRTPKMNSCAFAVSGPYCAFALKAASRDHIPCRASVIQVFRFLKFLGVPKCFFPLFKSFVAFSLFSPKIEAWLFKFSEFVFAHSLLSSQIESLCSWIEYLHCTGVLTLHPTQHWHFWCFPKKTIFVQSRQSCQKSLNFSCD